MQEARIANLKRAAQYPWRDDGACAVSAAAGEWKALVERCYGALDLSRIQFRDVDHRCPVGQVDAATLGPMVGICLLVQPELVVGAVVVIGVVVVAAAIAAELSKTCDCYCVDTGFVGDKVKAAYPIGHFENKYACIDECVRQGYPNGGFCR